MVDVMVRHSNKQSNILKGTKAYLCGNLQNENWDNAISWREYAKTELLKFGCKGLSPLDKVFKNFKKEDFGLHAQLRECLKNGDLETVHREMKTIRRRDLAMIDFANFAICVLNVEKPTYGTIEELVNCQKQNKEVFIVIQQKIINLPLWVGGMFKPDCFYNSIEDVIEKLKKIDSGEIEITTENWRIFEDKFI